MPEYDRGKVRSLYQAMVAWKRSHNSVKATLRYIDLEDRIASEDRILLNIIPDDESSLLRLLEWLRDILVGHTNPPEPGYHVSVTEPGEVVWFAANARGTPHQTCPTVRSPAPQLTSQRSPRPVAPLQVLPSASPARSLPSFRRRTRRLPDRIKGGLSPTRKPHGSSARPVAPLSA